MLTTRSIRKITHLYYNYSVMRVVTLDLMNFRQFRGFTAGSDGEHLLIVGNTGSGKTTLFNAVAIVLSWFTAFLTNKKGWDIRQDAVTQGEKYSSIELGMTYFLSKNNAIPDTWEVTNQPLVSGNIEDAAQAYLKRKVSVPTIAYYPAYRNICSFTRNQWDKKLTRNPENMDLTNAYNWVQAVFADDCRMPKSLKKQTIKTIEYCYPSKHKYQLTRWEKNYIAMIGDIIRKLYVNNKLGLADVLQGEAIVLIDEIDAHYSAKTQTYLLQRLQQAFPNTQFIVTSHTDELYTDNNTKIIYLDTPQ